jgi:ABC-2 type transport system permease protein
MIWRQIVAIAWAQLRTVRNHLPRTSAGSVLIWLFTALFYAVFVAGAVALALGIPRAPLAELHKWLPVGLLAMFLYWQIVPLFTLSTGWSLQINKLQIYPIPHGSLFGIEVLLRLTSAPDMLIVLTGAFAGLVQRADIGWGWPFLLLLYIPFNLLLSLGIRDLILHSFERNRFRELFAVLLISIGVLPQFLLRTGLGKKSVPQFLRLSQSAIAPWHAVASLTLGSFSMLQLGVIALWTAVAYVFARMQFQKSFTANASFQPVGSPARLKTRRRDWPALMFQDPLAALVQKEFQSLLRMPRFRVVFGMACVFSVVIFIPLSMRHGGGRVPFLAQNFLPVVNLYGLLLLSDVLLLNSFGFDGRTAQIYFVTPVPLKTVLRAKNIAAAGFIAAQTVAVLVIALLIRQSVTPVSVASGIGASAVVGVFLLAVGNLTSVSLPRPLDPAQTFKKQAGGKMQLWLMLCTIGIFILVGFAFLARWAFQSDVALLGVLLLEFVIGVIFYFIATDSAVEHGLRDREKMIGALSRSGSPIGLG